MPANFKRCRWLVVVFLKYLLLGFSVGTDRSSPIGPGSLVYLYGSLNSRDVGTERACVSLTAISEQTPCVPAGSGFLQNTGESVISGEQGCLLFCPLLCLRDFRPKYCLEVPCLLGFSCRRCPACVGGLATEPACAAWMRRSHACLGRTESRECCQLPQHWGNLSTGGNLSTRLPCWSTRFWLWAARTGWETDPAWLLGCSHQVWTGHKRRNI